MLDRLQTWLRSESVRAAYLTDPVSIAYLTGLRLNPHERLYGLVVTATEATVVLPALEEAGARSVVRGAALLPWADGSDPWPEVAQALAGIGHRLAVEKAHISLGSWEKLSDLTGVSEAVDVGPTLTRFRARKSPGELAALERAAQLTDLVSEAIWERLHEGMTEVEMGRALEALMSELGTSAAFGSIALSGPNSALPHGRQTGRRLQRGDLVLLDFGASHEGYAADVTRVGVVGPPSSEQAELHALVLAAHDAAVAAVEPGLTAGELDQIARAKIGAGGHADHFTHRLGHGLGLEAHEHPSLDPGSQTVLEEGMVITIEPGVYLPGWGGVRIEDDVVVEAGGARLLTKADRSLRSIQ
ncbi:MAG: Xaa-Pro peptidase family protein [Candidatus Dormibacteraeota bacterium]|nr:Xaa-Pro peptidase family protein [Candidatus Dormibacteraeota bacterium]